MPAFSRFLPFAIFLACAGSGQAAKRPLAAALTGAEKSKIQFVGQHSFTEQELKTAIGEQVRDINEKGATPPRADDAAFYIGSFYRKNGFSQVETEYSIRNGMVVVKIKEGARTLIREVSFIGNTSIPSDTLYDYMLGVDPAELAKHPEDFPFSEAIVAEGADRVRGLYVSQGYLDVIVDPSAVKFTEGRTAAHVTVRIEEKTRYTFGAISFSGATIFARDQLITALGEATDGPYSQTKITNMSRNLVSFYKSRGYYSAEVATVADPLKAIQGKVSATFTITPGALYRFDGVTVKNTTKTRARLRPSFLPKRFRHLTGKVYDPEKLDETYREMLRTGLFSSIRYTAVPLSDHTLRLDFQIEEAKSKEVGFVLGYSTYDGGVGGIRLADRDLFGRGRPLSLALEYSQRGPRGELLYVDPWLFDTRFAMRARLYSESRREQGYSKDLLGGRVDITRKVLSHLEVGVFGEQQIGKITDSSINEEFLGPTNYTLTSFGSTQTIDYRNDEINPTRGWILSTSIDYLTFDTGASFIRGFGRLSIYQPIGKKLLLALGARAGVIQPADTAEIPIDIRFFNGGATTVRSFAERELGPKDSKGNPLGGDFYSVLNAELIFPLVGALQGAAFVDAGSVSAADFDVQGGMRYAVGLGLRYKLPIGPLRLDYGLNPNPRPDEDRGAFHFSFGVAF
ncbi:MAG: BamA/TamA family outer membrane protein [Chthoniobacteraceae bacterium]